MARYSRGRRAVFAFYLHVALASTLVVCAFARVPTGLQLSVSPAQVVKLGISLQPASVCNVLDCPPFQLVHEESDFEIRRYRAAKWVETEPIQDVSFLKATTRGFHRLFEYIEGENANGTHVPMTAPAVTAIVPSAGPFCSSAFTVRLYVPKQYAESPPEPKPELKLKVVSLPARCVAVRKFGGLASDFNVAQQASSLADSLDHTPWAGIGDAATSEAYSIAQYNSPFELFKRVNEVWVPIATAELESCLPPSSIGA